MDDSNTTYKARKQLLENNFKSRYVFKFAVLISLMAIIVTFFTQPILSTSYGERINHLLRTINTTYTDLSMYSMTQLATLIANNLDQERMDWGVRFGGPEFVLVMDFTKAVKASWIIPIVAIIAGIGVFVHRRLFEGAMAVLGLAISFQLYLYMRLKLEITEYYAYVELDKGFYTLLTLFVITVILSGLLYKNRRMTTVFSSLIPYIGIFATATLSRRWLILVMYLTYMFYQVFPDYFIPVILTVQFVYFVLFLFMTDKSFDYTVRVATIKRRERHEARRMREAYKVEQEKNQLERLQQKIKDKQRNEKLNQ
ncbi:hypothetical protein [Haloplasma contractile]|uniref:Uncharacterized protein n=1 Tax=Haloplasma contractile SSD-17B TaxID=1033810 RepID=U2E8Q2_9MOLU|nr:hypothetical protein [Haloplasma contractile]ERJ11281.1 hypothetical protein HLPCO_002721 [Haloplasma contractile SSD-17B]